MGRKKAAPTPASDGEGWEPLLQAIEEYVWRVMKAIAILVGVQVMMALIFILGTIHAHWDGDWWAALNRPMD